MVHKKLLFVPVLFSLFASTVRAHCPLCTAAAGAGIALTRFYGVDDIIVGVWIGAFVVSTAMWAGRVLKKQYLPFQNFSLIALAFVMTAVPFYYAGLIGNPHFTLFGIDKLLLGMVLGSVLTPLAVFVSSVVKAKKGRTLIPFQTIVLVLGFLAIASVAVLGLLSLNG